MNVTDSNATYSITGDQRLRDYDCGSHYLKDFQRHNPSSFDGGKIDLVPIENWLEAMETVFFYMNCPLEYQIHCGTYMLKGEAHFWWKGA